MEQDPVSTRVLLGSFYRRLGVAVAHVPDNLDTEHVESLNPYPVLLYENVRMWEEEELELPPVDESGTEEGRAMVLDTQERVRNYVDKLSSGADSYVNDAFAVIHREDNKTVGALASEFRGRNAAGEHLAEEMAAISRVNVAEGGKILFIIAGGKDDKKKVVSNLAEFEFAHTLVGGKLASWVNPEDYPEGRVDVASLAEHGFDIDSASADRFAGEMTSGKYQVIVWNGPVGKFEDPEYIAGSNRIAEAIDLATRNGAFTMAGGGDTGNLFSMLNEERQETILVSHFCPGGGAMLAAYGGDRLNALVPLSK